MTIDFTETTGEPRQDSIPGSLADVEYPCDQCGRETGWSGRGRRKKLCDDCKPVARATTRAPRVSGNASNTAAQAAKVLVGINNMLAMAAMAVGLPGTAKQIMVAQEDFEGQAYQALLTDPKFAASILSSGAISAKGMLLMAYGTMGLGVAPTVAEELRVKKAERDAKKIEEAES